MHTPPSLAVSFIRTREACLGLGAPPSKSKENNTSEQEKERHQSHACHCPLDCHARTQRPLAPCKHTLLLLERQDVVQPHGVPIVSGGSRAADTSDDDPLSANTLRAPRRTTPCRTRACTTTSATTTSRRAFQKGVAADHASHEPMDG